MLGYLNEHRYKMEKIIIDENFILPYFSGNKRHKNYIKSIDEFYHMDFHFNGYFVPPVFAVDGKLPAINFNKTEISAVNPYFNRLIDARRPSESEQIKTYRRTIYLPESKSPCHKVYNSLRKITEANNWQPDYKDAEVSPGVADDETLEKYCEENYPEFDSIKNWFSTYAFKHMLVDSNALVYVLPKEFEISSGEYFKPVATIISCDNVYAYKESEYAIFKVDREFEFKSGNKWVKGICLGIITKDGYKEAQQTDSKMNFELVDVMDYALTKLPAWIMGSVIKTKNSDATLYNSFLNPMLPGLDGMAMAISDEDAEWVQHVYSTMWYFSSQDCNHCLGTGKVKGKGTQIIDCTVCKGLGNAPKSPYRDLVIKPASIGDNTTPTPPAGYIQKSTEIVKVFVERINKKEYRALSSLNMEFLAEAPLVNSGLSKQYDRQELNIFVSGVARHCIKNVLSPVYYFINEFRYMERVKDEAKRKGMLPKLHVPDDFDLITNNVLEEQLKNATDSKLDPEIIDEMENEYVAKNFPNNPELRERLKLKKCLDPFPRITIDEKSTLLLNQSVDKIDVVLSNYLQSFIEQALFEVPDFCGLKLDKQKEKMYEYAQEKMKSLDAAQKIKDKATLDKIKATPPGAKIPA